MWVEAYQEVIRHSLDHADALRIADEVCNKVADLIAQTRSRQVHDDVIKRITEQRAHGLRIRGLEGRAGETKRRCPADEEDPQR